MRIRTVKPEFFSDPIMCSLDPMSRLTFIGLWIMADDYGRLLDAPKTIAGELFPFDESVTSQTINEILENLANLSRIIRYSSNGCSVLFIVNWDKHQKIAHPTASKLPAPPLEDITAGEDTFQEKFVKNSDELPRNSVQEVGSRKKEVGRRKKEVGSEITDISQNLETPLRKKRASLVPDEFPITDKMRTWAKANNITLNLEEATQDWLDFWRSEGTLKADWEATWRNGMRSRQKRAQLRVVKPASSFEAQTSFLLNKIKNGG